MTQSENSLRIPRFRRHSVHRLKGLEMILKTIRVTNFKCINDSREFRIDPQVTCLVGKNESGKTALLQAIERLNSIEHNNNRFEILEYPSSRMLEYKRRSKTSPENVVHSTWELDADDVAAIEDELGAGCVLSRTVTVCKGYYDGMQIGIEIDDAVALTSLLDSHELHTEERAEFQNAATLEGIRSLLEEKGTGKKSSRSPREEALLESINDSAWKQASEFNAVARGMVLRRMPRMVYFSEYLRMPGQVSLSQIKNEDKRKGSPGHKVFLSLLEMIGRTPDDLEEIGEFEALQRELEGASNLLTKEIFRYWSQNRQLKVQFRFEQGLPNDQPPFNSGYVMRTRIENMRHGVTTSFDQRSTGFVWFFSFLVWFGQALKNYGEKLILLLDEPGMGLHAKAQSDLLHYINERLATTYQVIYTTHSPFMIDPEHLLRARTVEDIYRESSGGIPADDVGTTVGDQVLSTDKDTLFPLQACLGYEITQSLFVGKYTLLVEGPSEILYLPWFSRQLSAAGRIGLDKRWTLTPCGGADKIPAFLSLFAGQQLHVASLLDFAEGQKSKVRTLRESKLLLAGHVLTADAYAGQAEADIEDVIGREMYVQLVNDCYSLVEPIGIAKPETAPIRVVKEVEEHFRVVATDAVEFDHYRPAEFLTQQGAGYKPTGLASALDRFEKLFEDLNGILPTQ